jgi:hypothetical protein
VLDLGFYCYAAICTQNAARAVAVSQATGSGPGICAVALGELSGLPNVGASATCTPQSYPSGITAAAPISVCVASLSINATSDGLCSAATAHCADCAGSGTTATCAGVCTSVQATVAYQTMQMIPIPGVLMGKMTLTRTAEVRVIQ